jgi:hypothetical protein
MSVDAIAESLGLAVASRRVTSTRRSYRTALADNPIPRAFIRDLGRHHATS